MPMYQPSTRREADMKLDSQVLDLETAVKDGILGGGCGVIPTDFSSEKLDLKLMIEELEFVDVPTVFICPISLEPMQDPVTLCTGQTYERSNILKWFSLGRYTCPTTMQELWDDSVTPNKTLQQLIFSWFSQKYLAMKKRSEDVQGRVKEILENLKKVKGQARVQALKELRQVVQAHGIAKKTVVENGGVGLISSLLGPYTTHAVGSEVIGVLVNLNLISNIKSDLLQPAKMSLMVDILNEGSFETKLNCTRLITMLMEGNDFVSENVASLSLLVGLLRLAKDKKHQNGVLAGLSLLKVLCSHEQVRNSFVNVGAVPQLVELMPGLNNECLELVLYLLELLSNIPEGRLALKDCPLTIPNVVKLLMKASENCTQLALSILYVICKFAPEECASLALDAGLAAKLLLVIQSGCNPVLKQRSAELLKLCSLNYTTTIFISKCNLTRTIQ
ncbi:U-box domain-containing protein 30 [Hibiscus syriacus]|uniref:U-box domain-containing protein n=1 Tax=Hibiscus syriacus TaxID=106335 RepID=A0A6A3BJL5_HIBSY|nr:U-box domain-containing protein 30-like isoform X2 [Hibiscus syriacus]KAE8715628.1 U-box domain-containing protein 30 [Hibiscus syriacus]